MSCEFCERADFGNFSASMDKSCANISLAAGNYRFPKDKQFNFCPMCGEALSELKPMTEATEWIKCNDRLPEHRRSVLIYCPDSNNIYCADYQLNDDDCMREQGEWYYFEQGCGKRVVEKVAYWMPLLIPPKEDTTNA